MASQKDIRAIKRSSWKKYTDTIKRISDTASEKLEKYILAGHSEDEILAYAHALTTKYGEASSELACQMYEALAEYSGAMVMAAEPAATATYGETARAVRGEMMRTKEAATISKAAGRLVKLASVDTMMKNALRDGAEWAWIPSGDTCAFCLMLASNGWQRASKKAIKNGHASHIHNNCDCTYCVRFSDDVDVEGYDPESMYDEYIGAGDTQWERINAIRRKQYAANADKINAQKRAAYAKRQDYKKSTNGGNDGIIKTVTAGRVPNSITAATVQDKIQNYLLNSNHPRGKDKAKVLNSVLGFNYQNWDALSDQIFDKLQTTDYTAKVETKYGTKYTVPMRINGTKGKSMVVNTVWQVDRDTNIPRLITATFDKKTIRRE